MLKSVYITMVNQFWDTLKSLVSANSEWYHDIVYIQDKNNALFMGEVQLT